MPKSKRVKAVNLTQTSKKTKEQKVSFIEDVRQALDIHDTLYLFSYENMRSNKFKDIRMDLCRTDSRIFLGKNKLLQIALGKAPQDEYADNLHQVSCKISGSVGLLLTKKSRQDIFSYFEEKSEQQDFARAGNVATKTVIISKEMLALHPVSMVEQFRKLGFPVQVQNGVLGFHGGNEEHLLCKEGATLTAEACKLLVHFGMKLAEFRVTLECAWTDGQFEELNE